MFLQLLVLLLTFVERVALLQIRENNVEQDLTAMHLVLLASVKIIFRELFFFKYSNACFILKRLLLASLRFRTRIT